MLIKSFILHNTLKIFKGHSRTIKAKKNIIASLMIKGMSIIIGFLMVRLTLDYLNPIKYGIWLTISSFLGWFTFFEIGLGNGLKNKLAEALAIKDIKLAKIYVSTTYAILTIVIGIVALVFFVANYYIDWTTILNTDKELLDELTSLTFIVFGFFFLRFVIKLIGVVLMADQRPAIANSFGPLGNLISLILIYILAITTEGSLLYLAWILSVSPIVVLIGASIYFYSKEYKIIAPSFNSIDFNYAKVLLSLGVKFFVIQVSMIVLFQSSNIIIAQFFGPAEVTPYNIAYKLFSVELMLFTIIISPFWAAFTEAWVKKDIEWVKKTTKNLFYIWLGIVFFGAFLLLISDTFFELWLGKDQMDRIVISSRLKFLLFLQFGLFTFGGIFNMFINGVGKITVQMYSHIVGALIFLPISIFFIKYMHWGIESVVIATIVSNFYHPLIAPYQYKKIISNTAEGIWNR